MIAGGHFGWTGVSPEVQTPGGVSELYLSLCALLSNWPLFGTPGQKASSSTASRGYLRSSVSPSLLELGR